MSQALIQAKKARFISPPNPWVGCVIVKDNKIVGEGYTQPTGQAHAEVVALNQAKELAKEATLYVTLEPCSHYGRTPPCTDAIIKAGIITVFIGILDPDIKVSGQGVQQLRKAGIRVYLGACEKEISQLLAPYLHQRRTGLPFTIIKTAISLDGRTAAEDHTSQWITSCEARQDVHRLRAESQAIVIGSGTALKDKPRLNVRHDSIQLTKQPLRILLDSRGRVNADGPLFDQSIAPTLILTSSNCPVERRFEWEKTGAEVVVIPSTEETNLKTAWTSLGSRGILQVLVEGGSTLQTALIDEGLMDQMTVYIGSMLLGVGGLAFYRGHIPSIGKAHKLTLMDVTQFGNTIRVNYHCNGAIYSK